MRGFTLIETTVVITIIVLLSVAFLAYNRSSEEKIVLFRDQSVIVGALNRAKALTAEKFSENDDSCAYGVHFSKNESAFFIFQDLNAGGEQVFGCRNEDGSYATNFTYDAGEEMDMFSLDRRLNFGLSGGLDELDLVFIPPGLEVTSTIDLPVSISIGNSDGDSTAIITVGIAGQITVQ